MFDAPNFTQTPNVFFDDVAATLKEGELRVVIVLLRQTFGWHKTWDRISLSFLQKKTGMERKAVSNSLKSLIEKGFVEKVKEGPIGQEKCWYRLKTKMPKKDEEMPDFEHDLIEDSNNFYQYPKDTPPSILKIPTKETITKEKKTSTNVEVKENATATAFASSLFEELKSINKKMKEPDLKKWSKQIDEMMRIDKRSEEDVAKVLEWIKTGWWKGKIESPRKLREKFDKIMMQIILGEKKKTNKNNINSVENKFAKYETQVPEYLRIRMEMEEKTKKQNDG